MRITRATVLLAVLGALILQNVALAGPPLDHGDKSPEPLSPQMQRILEEKIRLAADYALVRQGMASRSPYEQRLAAFRASVGEKPRPAGFAPRARSGDMTTQSHASGFVLSTVQVPQSNGWYCGPGSGYTLLNFLGNVTSAYDTAHTLSQANLARTVYFRTDYYGNTPWYTSDSDPNGSHPVPAGLNRWRVGTISGWYIPVAYSSDLQLYKNNLVWDVHEGHPLMGNTVEVQNGTRYNGHPSGARIEHWIVLDGFYDYGDTTAYTDPAANSSLNWTNTLMYNSLSSATMLQSYLVHRGYVW